MLRNWLNSQLFEEKPDGGDGGGGAPPPGGEGDKPLTAADITKLVQDGINAGLNAFDAKWKKELDKVKTPPPPPPPPPPGEKKGGEQDEFTKAREKEFNDRIAQLEEDKKKADERASARELDAEVKGTLSNFSWNEGGSDIAFDYYKGKATRSESGELVIGTMPLAAYIKEHAPRNFKGMMPARQVGGSGAERGGAGGGTKEVQLEDIGPNMTAAQQKEVAAKLLILNAERKTRGY